MGINIVSSVAMIVCIVYWVMLILYCFRLDKFIILLIRSFGSIYYVHIIIIYIYI